MTSVSFYKDYGAFLDGFLEKWPEIATFLGDHRFDDRLGDYGPAGVEDQHRFMESWAAEFEKYEADDWDTESRIDLTITVNLARSIIREFEVTRAPQRMPGSMLGWIFQGINLLVLYESAPLHDRIVSILGRLRAVPHALESSRQVTEPAQVPRTWAENAIEAAQGGVGLFGSFLPKFAEATPELTSDVGEAGAGAASALEDHIAWLKENVLPEAVGEFSVGRDVFDEMLREDHMVDYDSQELFEIGNRLFDESDARLRETANEISPGSPVQEVLEDLKDEHPTAGSLLDAYRDAMNTARDFVIEHEVASIPDGESLRIEPTPEFSRPLIPYAAYLPPAVLSGGLDAIFVMTPVEEGTDVEQTEKKLREHPTAEIPLTALHEAYPGHHLQFAVASTIESNARKLGGFLSSIFIEGWAFYCEELMDQLGYLRTPAERLGRLRAERWRAARIVLDASLHTRDMTVEEGIAYLVENADLEPENAEAEVRRYTVSPTQPQSYMMGKREIEKVVEKYQRRYPDRSMLQMHDDLLAGGSIPPKLHEARLLGEDPN